MPEDKVAAARRNLLSGFGGFGKSGRALFAALRLAGPIERTKRRGAAGRGRIGARLDDVVRFIGQKVAAVVADSEDAAEEACRRLKVDYELLPALIDPEQAMLPGAPLVHPVVAKTAATRSR